MSGYNYNRQPLRLTKNAASLWGELALGPFREFLRLGSTGSDDELQSIVGFAGPWVETQCATSLAERSLVLKVDIADLYIVDAAGDTFIELPYGPVTSVESIAWTGGSETSPDLETDTRPERVKKPSGIAADALTLTINYTAGRASWSAFTPEEQFAVMVATSHFWQNREAVAIGATASPMPFMLTYALAAIDRNPIP
tara:strand:- start:2804 stop:3397 length:594 start_codon:yes stop_codon:yes gene_type:complete